MTKAVILSGKQSGADGSYNYDSLYANIQEELASADIKIINQEILII